MITFEYISFKLKLATVTDMKVDSAPITIQYYHFLKQRWVSLYSETLSKMATLDVRKIHPDPTVASDEEIYFFEMMTTGYIPQLRIIPGTDVTLPEGLGDKVLVGSNLYSFRLNEEAQTFEFDFGYLWIPQQEDIMQVADMFPDFIPTTSFFNSSGRVDTPETDPVPIKKLYNNLVSEITSANESSVGSPYKLSNISLKLKAVVHQDGDSLSASLLDLKNSGNINGNAISELTFDITPVQNKENNITEVPDLAGLTETAVRRILKSLGLKLNPVYQNNPDIVNGDSFKQSPAAGDSIQPNQVITVIFSKHE